MNFKEQLFFTDETACIGQLQRRRLLCLRKKPTLSMNTGKDLEMGSGDEPFIVRNNTEIAQILADLAKQKTRITVSFNHGNDTYYTYIIRVDTESQVAYLDIVLDERLNSMLLASNKVVFSKEDGVRIVWASTHLAAVTMTDGKAIKIALPRELKRFQRREYFRVATPTVNPGFCRIPMAEDATTGNKKYREFTLEDVSLGGVGVLMPAPPLSIFAAGTCFDGCEIGLLGVGVVSLKLCVRNIYSVPLSNGTVKYRLGLQYMNLSRANESLIQRYVIGLEREALAAAKRIKDAD